ncbi:unnamed protein product [Prorocentrum cordatum]|uniref:Uncharacterized protein n=1 Tax=Prorocentrum cordatum TaxID=2364126 RepID=A0ABN9TWQ8_9DINO|nr:unnamed protein product [Polarella glacialis]
MRRLGFAARVGRRPCMRDVVASLARAVAAADAQARPRAQPEVQPDVQIEDMPPIVDLIAAAAGVAPGAPCPAVPRSNLRPAAFLGERFVPAAAATVAAATTCT